MSVSRTSDHIQIKVKMPNPSKELQHPPMPKMGGLKGQGCSLLLQTMIESQNMEYGRIKDKWLYPNQDQDAKPQSRTYSILQSPKWGIKGHGCCLQCKIKKERQNLEHGSIKDYWSAQPELSNHYIQIQTTTTTTTHLGTYLDWDLFWTLQNLNWLYLGFHWSVWDQNFREHPSKVSDHTPINIKMPNPSQEPPASP